MMMAKYTRPNLSRTAENRSVGFFKILAYMSETFVFIYVGTTLFNHEGMMWAFLVFLTLVFFIVFITVVVNGGATTWLLERFDLRCSEPAYSTLLEGIETAGSPSQSGSPNSAKESSGGGILGKI
ncbi:hypothetical protein BSKO_12762 [Bryopsis sp. KO-2023]|nr:hypothetical protein BSKO_12754 [Bryopsis sp. KO-2023]GMH44810.1 hypothetical protein BSKO_12762 [Bryopsis sp. KO-2023]